MILITGINGLLGSFFCQALLERGEKVVGLVREYSDLSLLDTKHPALTLVQGDILDILSLQSLFDQHAIKYVIHAAAMVSFNRKAKNQMHYVNVEGTKNVVNVALQSNIHKFLHVSSVAALGRSSKGNVNEDNTWVNSPYNSTYAISKHHAELEVWRGKVEGLNTVIVNPSFILAPANGVRSSSRYLKFVEQQQAFYPTGNINYIDIRDVVNLSLKLLFSEIQNERFILNAGSISYKEFFQEAANVARLKAPRFPVKKFLGYIALLGENIRSAIGKREPMITSESLKTSRSKVIFDNAKIIGLFDYKFIPLPESLDWVWKQYISTRGVEK